jgi:hypothetical protein
VPKIQHQHHFHTDQADYEDCVRRDKRFTRAALATFAFIVLAAACLSCLYAQFVYGDWTCGLPGVECRKVIAP